MAATKSRSTADTVRVDGLKGTVKRLKTFDASVGRELKLIAKSSAEIVAAEAQHEAPVGTSEERDKHPGLLGHSIKAFGAQAVARVQAGGAKLPYVGPIHFGWAAHHIKANQFLFKALATQSGAVRQRYEREIAALVERVEGSSDG